MVTAVRERISECIRRQLHCRPLQRLIRIPGKAPIRRAGVLPIGQDLAAFVKSEMEAAGLQTEIVTLVEGKPNVFGTRTTWP